MSGRPKGSKNKKPSLMDLIREYAQAEHNRGRAVAYLAATGYDQYQSKLAVKRVEKTFEALAEAIGGFHGEAF